MKQIVYSAPGKVILSGEHAVVYGRPALVCAIDKRLTISITPSKTSAPSNQGMKTVEKGVRDFLKQKKIPVPELFFSYSVDSQIPIGRGLGSSAAFSAAASAALLELYTGQEWSLEEINNCAYKIEQVFHKNPSGVDNTAAVFGGLIYFRKEFEFLKTISSLSLKIPSSIEQNLFLIDSGKPEETTAQMVENVGKLYNRKGLLIDKTLRNIEKITKRIVVSFAKEDTVFFRKSIEDNQKELEKLGVVSGKTKSLLKHLQPFGVGKVTGAGGTLGASGFLLFYVEKRERFLAFIQGKRLESMVFHSSYLGLKKII